MSWVHLREGICIYRRRCTYHEEYMLRNYSIMHTKGWSLVHVLNSKEDNIPQMSHIETRFCWLYSPSTANTEVHLQSHAKSNDEQRMHIIYTQNTILFTRSIYLHRHYQSCIIHLMYVIEQTP